MGMFDVIRSEGREGQVKVWGNTMSQYKMLDRVPPLDGLQSYVIKMREGGYVWVDRSMLTLWTDSNVRPELALFDKWGRRLNNETEEPVDER